jgi:uncharacterized protein YbjQ (UPF0145 family)
MRGLVGVMQAQMVDLQREWSDLLAEVQVVGGRAEEAEQARDQAMEELRQRKEHTAEQMGALQVRSQLWSGEYGGPAGQKPTVVW